MYTQEKLIALRDQLKEFQKFLDADICEGPETRLFEGKSLRVMKQVFKLSSEMFSGYEDLLNK